ncbi:hypothetical protein H105_01372 [Trichophyton soudanense CBS 452.61]|uniref:Uncharacterized protein n=1 Tax=Trichophyton soudanense CBS 452.61 TaxID=1215331 RepID=A0A022Y310_TRISD|nr:hypothetical protein H105_01372 [Trichophyton soudanense CBS 452.61]EZG09858.1 hypothetical protein H106_01128 [Trichophyton rubrum CBS 735.88]
MRFSTILSACIAIAGVNAAPAGWSPGSAKWLTEIGDYISKHANQGFPRQPNCDLSKAVLPSNPRLSEIPPDQKLLAVAVGRGTQNYTCAGLSPDQAPKATGAVATLFDASCIASNYPYLLSLLPNVALELTNPSPFTNSRGPVDLMVMGHHYFDGEGVPTFDMPKLGICGVKKVDSKDAPPNAMKGVKDEQEGAVSWLMLESTPSSKGQAKRVYRVNTAGGKAPPTCVGLPEQIQIQYSAEYWFYG